MSVTNNEITNKKVLTNEERAEFFGWQLNSNGTAEKFRVVAELSACDA
ncbi:hypothetical protein HXA32_04465 [Salipaludibacillus agaradhaerens]|nr:hypothetical protein [Salipaludibacillus agaradhaerens]MCR6105527.1 hypothetical protein [Salipaludibacillus agaradhaerens]